MVMPSKRTSNPPNNTTLSTAISWVTTATNRSAATYVNHGATEGTENLF
jgi:hypothetical protein